ncbi:MULTISPECIES: TetR/AcrR family transcriptional regulator [unclassified Streptomyces]|uniref:TetR/AcrR family transcriptional regulator n=1 Tax=Streptomyces niveiscabiei TaxID=164115 RepID=A0ABW9HJ71_9ACTN|nr:MULTISPECIES: TetR/AcrR family transcriptional regulator [unclassified Streptomyces]QZZ24999.1 TetR/AcrR family transcriptional regulator [Streptomyces sp. ST1015]
MNTPQGSDSSGSLTAQRSRGRPRDERIDTAVRKAVTEILNEVGYGRLTLEAVAARAGTTKPTLRRRWRSRQHLVVSALVQTMGSSPTPDTGCTHCDLIVGIRTLSHAFTTTIGRRALPALIADLADDPELESEFLGELFHPRRAATAAALRRGIRRGDIRADADIDLLLDMLASTAYYRVLFGHLPLTPTLAEDVVEVVLRGVATPQWHSSHGSVHTP